LSQLLPRSVPFDPLAFGLDIARRYGDLAYYHLGPLHVYQVNHPDLARQILVEHAERFLKPRLLKHAFRPFAGEGLLTSDGPLWKQQRKLIQPAFHHAHLAAYATVMVGYARQLIDRLEDGQVLEIQSEMARLTLGIVVKSLFGADVTREAADVGKLMVAVLDAANQRLNSIFRVPSWVPSRRNLHEKRALARLDAILRSLIVERRSSAGHGDDLLSVLLRATDDESRVRMSDRQLRDEMMTLFLAGHETTATALTWTWYLLSQHPDVDAKLTGELDRVLGQRTPTAADLSNLPYTDMIVREVLRLYPPAPGVAREPLEDVTLAGYVVPRGSLISIDTYAMHRDPRFFHDPERFDPERFAAGWEDRIPRYAYLPFGGGPRVCIGSGFALMEARLILATVAQRFRLTLEPNQDVRPIQLVTVRPRDGVRMRATTRVRHVAV
jgi:cytochrome P450